MIKQNYYFTFGQKYAQESHPRYERAHPSGWVRIVAESYEAARNYAITELFGTYFATQYTEKGWRPEFFPGGEIECIEI